MKRGIALIVLLLLLVGCGLQGGKEQSDITKVDVYKGSKALEMKFLDNAPPKTTYELGVFPVGLEIRNEGASDIKRGHLTITLEKQYMESLEGEDAWSGLDATTFAKEGNNVIFNLIGRSIESPSPKIGNVFHKVKAKNIDVQSEVHTSKILATACYVYETFARPEVCLDPDVFGLSQDEKPCKMQDVSLSSQGAPVAITKVEVKMLPTEEKQDEQDLFLPAFHIRVQNKGNGEVVYSTKVADACSAKALSFDDYNTYEVEAKLNGIPLECTPKPFRLRKKEDFIRCYARAGNYIAGNVPSFSSILEINVKYGYTMTISRDVDINRNPRVNV